MNHNNQILLQALFSKHLSYSNWLPITACMCYNPITGSVPSYLSELLHLYSPSCSLCSWSDTFSKTSASTIKPMAFMLSCTSAPTSGTISSETSGYSLFLQKQTQDIPLLTILQLSRTVFHPYVCTVCVCVCVCVCECARMHASCT